MPSPFRIASSRNESPKTRQAMQEKEIDLLLALRHRVGAGVCAVFFRLLAEL